jgi:hypothetical protein
MEELVGAVGTLSREFKDRLYNEMDSTMYTLIMDAYLTSNRRGMIQVTEGRPVVVKPESLRLTLTPGKGGYTHLSEYLTHAAARGYSDAGTTRGRGVEDYVGRGRSSGITYR